MSRDYIGYMKPHYPFIASKNYKGGDLLQVCVTPLTSRLLMTCTDPWSLGLTLTCEPAKFELCQGTWDQSTRRRR
jgi:hypothetical protein